MKTVAGLFLIGLDLFTKMFRGMFNISKESISSIIFYALIFTGLFLLLWIYMHWLIAIILIIALWVITAILVSDNNNNFNGWAIMLSILFAVAFSVGAMFQIKTQEPKLDLITKVNLNKQNFKDREMIINLKGIQIEIEADNSCREGEEMRIYHGTKEIFFIGDCTECNKYVGICEEEIKRQIVEVN